MTNKDGGLITTVGGEPMLAQPDASFLSVVRAYLKDLMGTGDDTKKPKTGQPREGGLLDQYMKTAGKGLPFGRPQ